MAFIPWWIGTANAAECSVQRLREVEAAFDVDRDLARALSGAETCLEDAVAPVAAAGAHALVAALHHQFGDPEIAAVHYAARLAFRVSEYGLTDPRTLMGRFDVARNLARMGKFESAVVELETLLEADASVASGLSTDHRFRAIILLLNARQNFGDHSGVSEAVELGKTLARDAAENPDEPVLNARMNFANEVFQVGDHVWATEEHERILAASRALHGDMHPTTFAATLNVGMAMYHLGDLDRAAVLCARALDIGLQVHGANSPMVAPALDALGMHAWASAEPAKARDYVLRAHAIRVEGLPPDAVARARGLVNLTQVTMASGMADEALTFSREAVDILEKHRATEPVMWAQSKLSMALVLRELSRVDEAVEMMPSILETFERTLGSDHSVTGWAWLDYAHLLRDIDDREGAHEAASRGVEGIRGDLGEHHYQYAGALTHQAIIYGSSRDDEVIEMTERALEILVASVGPDHWRNANALMVLGVARLRQGDRERGRAHIFKAIELQGAWTALVVETASERDALAVIATHRDRLNTFLSTSGDPFSAEEAYAEVLRWKGHVGRMVAARKVAQADASDPERLEQVRALRRTRLRLSQLLLADPGPDVEERRAQIAALELQRSEEEQRLASWSAVPTADAHPDQLGEALPSDTVLVDFFRYTFVNDGEDRLIAFVLDDQQVRRVELGAAGPVEDAVAEWRESLAYRDALGEPLLTSRIDSRGAAVARLVFDPLDLQASTVVIVPDGALAGLPFGALPAGRGEYLLQSYTFGYLETAQSLLQQPIAGSAGPALLVGDVDFGEPDPDAASGCVQRDWPHLPGTAVELDALERQLKRRRKSTTRSLARGFATEGSVMREMRGAELIHIASHGFFVTETCAAEDAAAYNPMMLSGLVLAGANTRRGSDIKRDGLLTAEEVSLLDLRQARLVVLSACNTGLGEIRSGEGVLGLRRAFAVAGAGSLVMSLWSTLDEETATLMSVFYGYFLHKRRPLAPVEALRQAQLAMLEDNRRTHGDARPSDWAAFIATGVR